MAFMPGEKIAETSFRIVFVFFAEQEKEEAKSVGME